MTSTRDLMWEAAKLLAELPLDIDDLGRTDMSAAKDWYARKRNLLERIQAAYDDVRPQIYDAVSAQLDEEYGSHAYDAAVRLTDAVMDVLSDATGDAGPGRPTGSSPSSSRPVLGDGGRASKWGLSEHLKVLPKDFES